MAIESSQPRPYNVHVLLQVQMPLNPKTRTSHPVLLAADGLLLLNRQNLIEA